MKKNVIIILFATVLTLTASSCKEKAKEAATTESESPISTQESTNLETFTANKEASIIEWKGFKPTGSHNGTIAIDNGLLKMIDDEIVGGTFNIDMTSIVVEDIPADDKKNGKLLGHLNSPDFFDSENHPLATFIITGTKETEGKTMLSGNLSIKGIDNNITFPVTVNKDEKGVVITSEVFSINRSKWEVKYGSKSFFDNLGDKFINDDIELKLIVKTKKG